MTNCNDGWLSPSIGGNGTCSHHGGIACRVSSTPAPRLEVSHARTRWVEWGLTLALASFVGWRQR